MDVKQIYTLVNTATQEVLGESGIVNEDMRNLVDIGQAIFDADQVDNYVKSLVNHIGRVIFVNRPYSGSVPSVMREAWQFGAVLEKISFDLPDASENEAWDLQDGAVYEQQTFYKPSVSAKFFNKMATFEVDISITKKQVEESFSSASQLNGFVAGIYSAVDKTMTIKVDALVMRTINTLIACTIYDEYPDPSNTTPYGDSSGVRAVNLLYLYNQQFPTTPTTVAKCLTNPDFIRFATAKIGIDMARLTKMSTLFNVGGKPRFTPTDMLTTVMIADFRKYAEVYLQSDTFWKDLVALPGGIETIPYWQGSGTTYSFSDISNIDVKTPDNHTVDISGVLAVMFDKDACMVCSEDRQVDAVYNGKARFWNNYYHFDCKYFCDLDENCIVYFVADASEDDDE